MSYQVCGDDRIKVIARAKAHLLRATNIESSPEEMAVLDDFIMRCWQMGWLERYEFDFDRYIDPTGKNPTLYKCPICGNFDAKARADGELFCDFCGNVIHREAFRGALKVKHAKDDEEATK